MVGRKHAVVAIVGLLLLVVATGPHGAQFRLALEDRADPNPRQVAMAVELAGLCVGVIVSWTQRMRSAD